MRSLIGLFGAFTAIVTVAMVARHGYVSADAHVDGLIAAFLFGTIAAGGLGGHVVAARLWRTHPGGSIAVGLVAAAALIVNLSNSVGAIAGRGDKVLAERLQAAEGARDARAMMTRLQRDRDAIPSSVPATQAMINAAHDAVAAAERARAGECDRRGPLCRQRETEELAARSAHASTIAAFALSERGRQLDEQLATLRLKLEQAPAIGTVNPQAALIARLFRMPDVSMAATGQQVSIAIVVELLIVGALMAFELLGYAGKMGQRAVAAVSAIPLVIEGAGESRVPTPDRAAHERLPPPRRRTVPRLIDNNAASSGAADDPTQEAVAAILTDLLEPATRRDRVSLEEIYMAYVERSKVHNMKYLEPNAFLDPLQRFCKLCGIQTSVTGKSIYLLGVVLNRSSAAQVA
jgi:hypothetical protein